MSSFSELTAKQARELIRDLEQFLDRYDPKEDAEDAHQEMQGKFTASEWEEKAIKSKLANVLIAPEDYYELNDNADGTEKKEHFTWEEAIALEKKVGNGWRLPTRHEWALICEEFANDENGGLSSEMLRKSLALSLSGYTTASGKLDGVGSDGNYWSRTTRGPDDTDSSPLVYFLDLRPSSVDYQSFNSQVFGFAVRMVKELPHE